MMDPGKINVLTVVRETKAGWYVADEEKNEVLLPLSHKKSNFDLKDKIEVFVYPDAEGKMLASLEKPYAQVNSFAYLRVTSLTSFGAFLDWGLEKDLLVPASEQMEEMEQDLFYVVYIYIDKMNGRIVAS